MYRTYSVNDMPQPIMHKSGADDKHDTRCSACAENDISPCTDDAPKRCDDECAGECRRRCGTGGLFAGLKLDDVIIFAVIIILLMDNCDDKLLIIALGFLLFSDFFN